MDLYGVYYMGVKHCEALHMAGVGRGALPAQFSFSIFSPVKGTGALGSLPLVAVTVGQTVGQTVIQTVGQTSYI